MNQAIGIPPSAGPCRLSHRCRVGAVRCAGGERCTILRHCRRPGAVSCTARGTLVERKLDYTYMGFTSKYSCDGLRDSVREVLLALGARKKDLKIQSGGCINSEGVEPFPGVAATFSVLVPVTPMRSGRSETVRRSRPSGTLSIWSN